MSAVSLKNFKSNVSCVNSKAIETDQMLQAFDYQMPSSFLEATKKLQSFKVMLTSNLISNFLDKFWIKYLLQNFDNKHSEKHQCVNKYYINNSKQYFQTNKKISYESSQCFYNR